jgi:Tol biopolymer transport system component
MNTNQKVLSICLMVLFLSTCSQGEKKSVPAAGSEENLKARIPFKGRIIFQSNMDGDNEIYLLTQDSLQKLTDNDTDDLFPVWSPSGDRIAFSSNRGGKYDIYTMTPDGSNQQALINTDADEKEPAWFPDGESLVFTRETKKLLRRKGALFQYNLRTRKTTRIIPDFSNAHGIAHISPSGTMLTFTGKRTMGWDAAVFDLELNKVTFLAEGGKSCRGRFSHDGKNLAFVSSQADGKGDIWMMAPEGGDKTRLTIRDDTYDYFPSWSPEGDFILFNSSRQHDHDGDWQLYIFDRETRTATLLFDSPGSDIFPDWN